jgi:8-hydroxy-5-deazaflavin:NADPH oxidoreductase
MNIAILGTGMVGQTIASALIQKGHQVMLGSRTANNEQAVAWTASNGASASNGTFADAAAFGEILFICLNGNGAVDALQSAGAENFNHKVVIDLTNPLDFSNGMPPSLLPQYCNTWSMGEEIQKQLPGAHVVKALNTVTANLMVDASRVNNGHHNLFICGNDAAAKSKVKNLLAENFNWKPELILDLGTINYARMTEAIVPFWVAVMQAEKTPMFNYMIVT